VWLRETVHIGFYPLLAWEGILLTLLTIRVARTRGLRARRFVMAGTLVLWIAFFGIGMLTFANNLANILEGRALHWHAPLR
jgi:hypothetical protein